MHTSWDWVGMETGQFNAEATEHNNPATDESLMRPFSAIKGGLYKDSCWSTYSWLV